MYEFIHTYIPLDLLPDGKELTVLEDVEDS